MQFGLPILTSDRDFARHICQDAALYFDPLDADSVARSMARRDGFGASSSTRFAK